MYLLYTCLSLVAFAALAPYFAWQALRYRKYVVNLRQRLGYLPVSFNVDGDESIWIHAVSVGETLAARPLASALKARYPGLRLFVSTTTVAGQQVAAREIKEADATFYFPIRPRAHRPPDHAPGAAPSPGRHGNGDLAEPAPRVPPPGRAHRDGQRPHLEPLLPPLPQIRPFIRRVLADVDRFCMQSQESADRVVALGADPSRVRVTGNLKFDALPAGHPGPERGGPRVLRYFRVAEGRPVIVAGSTMKGEDVPVLKAFARLRTGEERPLLVVAPRHPERFDEAERLAREEGFRVARRSALEIDREPPADVVILDTIGELAQLYRAATVVFVGGSLVPTGGHNILEPAVFGKPIIFGPHMQNFREIATTFLEAGAAEQVSSGEGLEEALRELLADPRRRERLGQAARAIIEVNHGAGERTLAAIAEVLTPGDGRKLRPFRLVR